MVIAFQSSTVKSLELEDILLGHADAKAFPTRTQLPCGQVCEKKGKLKGK